MVCIESLDQEKKKQGYPPNHTEGTSAFTKCCKLHLQNQTRSNPDTNLSSIRRKLLQTKYKNQSERFNHVWSIANRVDAFNSLNNLAQKTKPASAMRNKEHGSSQRTRTQPFFGGQNGPPDRCGVRQDNSNTCKHGTWKPQKLIQDTKKKLAKARNWDTTK